MKFSILRTTDSTVTSLSISPPFMSVRKVRRRTESRGRGIGMGLTTP